MEPRDRIFVALDTPDVERARRLVRLLSPHVGGFKVGLELFISTGPALVSEIRDGEAAVFLDLKLHDIPNTVAGAAAAIARMGVDFFTIHASGGPSMIRRCVDAAADASDAARLPRPTALAVSVLTSHDDADLERIGLAGPCASAVSRLAALAREAGAGGVVCSPLEVRRIREEFPGGTLVVPGIRPAGDGTHNDDQARTATPARAVADGADRLVIGRPITRAADPVAAAASICRELAQS